MSDRVVNIARCPKHGLHGCRERCFVCDGPVEQVLMVPAIYAQVMLDRIDAVRAHAVAMATRARALGRGDEERGWLDAIILLERLLDGEAGE